MGETLSIIIPFYKGNAVINRLLMNIEKLNILVTENSAWKIEIIIVNDSPECTVQIDSMYKTKVKIINNKKNIGIQGSRINGLENCQGTWILFIDQDDLIVPKNLFKEISNLDEDKYGDVGLIIGNAYYYFGNVRKKIYTNIQEMKRATDNNTFVYIRNTIVSPGCCLIRKKDIPSFWEKNILKINGVDDWFLWLLMFNSDIKIALNSDVVYIHQDSEGNNLSYDLDKMHDSSLEMIRMLSFNDSFSCKKLNRLKREEMFKYYKDTKKLTFARIIKYFDCIVINVIYKLMILKAKYI